ncbi:SDR family NAD(P)-dependent oxidoreductase [Nocardia sp. NPDC004123]
MTKPEDNTQKLAQALRVSLKETERLRARNRKLDAALREPIAIVGMACRYPGGVSSPEDLWNLVAEGTDATSEFPGNRGWDVDRLYDATGETPNSTYTREGGFLHSAGEFDPAFFNISPNEAALMDPQQFLLLETSWEAFERAGVDPGSLKGSRTGVWVGMMYHDYPANANSGSIASGRVSYVFGLEGPSVTVDTACSSSLVAMHSAAASLRSGECDLALAGGVAVMATPETFVEFSRQRGLSPDGRCKSFSDTADGVGWSEGVGVLVLERLSDAQRNGHRILAVIAGSAVNQDGASNGLTAPNGPSQRRVIRQALTNAGVSPAEVDVVEAHGTGTTLGDPIEAQALLATYGQERDADRPLWLGSLKSNIGHAQAAAGVGGVIKMVMAMRHGVLPRTLHVDQPSTKVDWSEGHVRLLTEAVAWPEADRPRRAGVSSFGISGTNAHVIVEQAPATEPAVDQAPVAKTVPAGGLLPWVVSARNAEALAGQAARLTSHAAEHDPIDLGFSLASTRAVLEHRAVVVAEDRDGLLAGVGALGRTETIPGVVSGRVVSGSTGVVFSGQGAQWAGMAVELRAAYPVFAEAFDGIVAELDPLLGQSVSLSEALADADLVDRTVFAQAGLFAFEVALFRLLECWGVRADVVAGHSIGEVAAAHVAGVLSLADACALVAARGRLMQALPTGGAMVAVGASEADVLPLLVAGRVSIAAVNGPSSVVLSGVEDAVAAVVEACAERGWRTHKLRVSHAFHSALMEPMLAEFATAIAGLAFARPTIPLISTVTGVRIAEEMIDPSYWVGQVRDTVRFADAVAAMANSGVSRFAEVGPDAVLTPMIAQTLDDAATVVALARRDRADSFSVLSGVAALFVSGADVDWAGFYADSGAQRIDLPTYAFQHRRFWIAAGAVGGDARAMGLAATGHPLVPVVVSQPDSDAVTLTGRLSAQTHPWLADHRVMDTVLFPGTGLVELALQAGEQVGCSALEELVLRVPLVLPESAGVAVRVVVGAQDAAGRRGVRVYSCPDDGVDAVPLWTLNAEGVLASGFDSAPADLAQWPPAGATAVDIDGVYDSLDAQGYHYGPVFQALTSVWRGTDGLLYAEVELPEQARPDAKRFGVHPALLDAALHALRFADGMPAEGAGLALPFEWSGVAVHATGAGALRVRLTRVGEHAVTLDLADPTGTPVATVRQLASRPIDPAQLTGSASAVGNALFQIGWEPISVGEVEVGTVSWADLGDEVPAAVVFDCPEGNDPAAIHAATHAALAVVQSWIADARFAESTLVVRTGGAVSVAGEDITNLAGAAVGGLVRSAQAENPGRIVLVDTDSALDGLLGGILTAQEPQVAVRAGQVHGARLSRASAATASATDPFDPDDTVLITGASGLLGGLFARHLVDTHGVRRLLLLSRRGEAAPGAAELRTELQRLGAEVEFVACDVADRDALAQAIANVPAAHPLTGVFHMAGVLDDGAIASLTPARMDAALGPKVDAALHLHELTADLPLKAFVLFSSVAGAFGNAGQGNYAAANACLDALAALRRAAGSHSQSLAWGLWDGGMAGQLSDADLHRISRSGLLPLSEDQGLALFDAATASDVPAPILARLDLDSLRGAEFAVPVLFSGLIPARRRAASGAATPLRARLANTPDSERFGVLVEIVRGQVAAILGHQNTNAIAADKAFGELGFDSITAVEFRNALKAVTGLSLPATLVFDYPTPQSLAKYLADEFTGTGRETEVTASAAVDDEPIAVVAMSCRYPGGVASPEDLWKLVTSGIDATGEMPTDRGWDIEGIYDAEPGHAGKTYTRQGGFLYSAAEFDAEFFGISPNEAAMMDPQQRLLLEVSWEALERAGVDPAVLCGSSTGVFTGMMYHDYAQGTGNNATGSLVSGRVSYVFGLEGPAVTVDTACSSSLVAMHLAAQSLRSGECDLALAGGVAVMATPETFVEFSRQRGLSPDGRCKSFSDTADGVGWSEGAGVLVLERLSDARRNGHQVLAVIAGSAVNQDGASNGLTAPNGPSQRRVIRQALANAGISPVEVDAVEAHGTGTTLGDPIEAQALLATYGQDRDADRPLWLGSLKSNIGHAQAAAGVGGVIKMVMAMQHGVLPRTLHADQPSTKVDWSEGHVRLLTEAVAWPETDRPRRAGVSSFGISGTNAHLIVEQAPVAPVAESAPVIETVPAALPWVVSARGGDALAGQAARLASSVGEHDPIDIGFSLASARTVLEHRAVVVAEEREGLLAGLRSLAAGVQAPGVVTGRPVSGSTGVVFSGQGAQWAGMANELRAAYPVFAETFDAIVAELNPMLGQQVSLGEALVDSDLVNQTVFAQAGLFAFEVALFRLLESWGVRADVVAGHSIGEVAAAHVAGVLSLTDACVLVAARGRLMQALPTGGAMVAVGASEADVLPLLVAGRVSIAAVNGPSSVVLSGVEDDVVAVADRCAEQGWRTHRLRVSHAFHSVLMEPMLAEFATAIDGLVFAHPSIPLVSTVTGARIVGEMCDPSYWVGQVRESMRFADAVVAMADSGVSRFAEVGPDAVLTPMVAQTLDDGAAAVVALARRDRADVTTLLGGVAGLFVTGAQVDWAALYTGSGARRIDLPTYAFQRRRYWMAPTSTGSGDARSMGFVASGHPLVSAVVSQPDSEVVTLSGRLSAQTQPWLADHKVMDTVLLPGTGLVELALQAGEHVGCATLDELVLQAPLVVPESAGVAVRVVVAAPDGAGRRGVRIFSCPDSGADSASSWILNAEGVLAPDEVAADFDLAAWPPAGAQPMDIDGVYDELFDLGYGYGPLFQGLQAAWHRDGELFAEVALPDPQGANGFGIHPALFDAALHAGIVHGRRNGGGDSPVLPFTWNRVALHTVGAAAVRVHIAVQDNRFAVQLADEQGQPVLSVDALVSRPVSAERLGGRRASEALFGVEWVAAGLSDGVTVEPDRLAILGSDQGVDGVPGHRDLAALIADLDANPDAVVPEIVLLDCPRGFGREPEAARQVVTGALDTVQRWLAESRFAGSRLVVLTRQAVTVAHVEQVRLDQAPVWGLVRAAQAEHPGRFQLLDLDGDGESFAAATAVAAVASEPEVALRGTSVLVPRLSRHASGTIVRSAASGTVLITGGTGGLGAVIARHLVTEHGVRQLLLTGRRGPDAPGATELRDELVELGAEVTIAACDVSDRDALAALLDTISDQHPLAGVIHAAGTADNGLIESITPDRIEQVFRPKVDAAWHLHELTRDRSLELFVLVSSAGGLVLAAGQANYAAANVFLDALAAHRRGLGLPATSIDYGLWARSTALGAELSESDFDRMRRQGYPPLTEAEGLALFDAAIATDDAQLVALRVDPAILRTQGERIPALLRSVVPTPVRRQTRTAAGQAFLRKLAGLSDSDRDSALLELVRSTAADILGHASMAAVEPRQAFQQLGFDSLSAVEFRNKLNTATGLQLPATLVFDYPNPQVVAEFIGSQLTGTGAVEELATSRVRADDEPIAVVAMGCRYPGGVMSPEDLWSLVVSGADTTGELPVDRGWDIDGIYDPEPGKAGRTYTRRGGFLYSAAEFDAEFFGISPNEATMMDPQQRLLLEVSWEALERAGVDPAVLRGSSTGVFTGVMYHDYAQGTGTGASTGGSLVSGRIAYTLGLEGPAVSVDTACSSSLVALHLASQSLRSGECDLALAGGVAVMATPDMFLEFSRQRGLSPDGRCKSFADAADGVAWSEGAGMLVLERLSDAQRNGHQILAVIAGSAVNQDGASNGLTAPNGPSQRRVIRQALANARVTSTNVDVVEAHGTGTTLGDPIEAQALLATYGQDREADRPLWLGSLKSNIGHAQAAAGVGGVIKMVMAMRHGLLPRTLHVDQPSTKVDWSEGHIRLLTEAVAWPEVDRPRRAGVSSFGISGTNAHLIVEQAPAAAPAPVAKTAPAGAVLPWVLSARTDEALAEQAARLTSHMDDHDHDPIDIGFSLVTSRVLFDHRAVVLSPEHDGLRAGARAVGRGEATPGVVSGRVMPGSTGLVFSGQGAQWAGMAAELRAAYPVFAEAFDAIVAELEPLLGQQVSLSEALAGADLVDQTVFAQAGLFAFEVALFRLLASWGVRADVVAGHSIGEVAAAHVAGVLSLTDACVLVAARGRLMQALPTGGAMVAVGASETDVRALLAAGDVPAGEVSIAAVNGPSSVVLSGVEDAVVTVAERCAGHGWRTHRLRVSHAFHSALMEPMLAEFASAIEGLIFARSSIPLVSTVTGARIGDEMSDPSYWVDQVRDTVRFADAVTAMAGLGVSRFAEVGPDAVLTPMVAQTLDDGAAAVVALARRGQADASAVLAGVAGLFVTGAHVDWAGLYTGTGAGRIDLPTYAFQRSRYWMLDGSAAGGDARAMGLAATGHPLASVVVSQPDSDAVTLTGRLSVQAHPWLADHTVMDTVLFPGTGLVELALHAGEQVGCSTLEELVLQVPLALPESAGLPVRVVAGAPDETGRRAVRIFSRPEDGVDAAPAWTLHAEGVLAPGIGSAPVDLVQWPPAGAVAVDIDGAYDSLDAQGYHYGPVFQALKSVWRAADGLLYAEVELPEAARAEAGRFGLHPALLDAALHALRFAEDTSAEGAGLALPFEWSGVSVHAAGADALRVRLTRAGEHGVAIDLADSTGAPVATVRHLASRPIDPAQLTMGASVIGNGLFQIDWTPITVRPTEVTAVVWPDLGEQVPPVVVLECPTGDDLAAIHAAAHDVLEILQSWIADRRFTESVLVVRTSGAVSVAGEDITNLAGAAVGGLVRAAQAENPGRIVLIDSDSALDGLLGGIVAAAEPQLAVRDGQVHIARLGRAAATAATVAPAFDPDDTVLITGAGGLLAGMFARHLVAARGVRRLLLLSRRGESAPGAAELGAELRQLGAEVEFAACDVADRGALAEVLAGVPADRPLTGVFHLAGVLDDGAIASLTPARMDTVLGPKVDAALHLHELTAGLPLQAFVLFSSVAGAFGNPGQGNYAAANACLDALAAHRRASGSRGTSLAWGLWDGGMAGQLSDVDRQRLSRSGMLPLSEEQGLALFDAALEIDVAAPVVARLDFESIRSAGTAAPALFAGLIPARRKAASGAFTALRARLANTAESERFDVLVEIVRAQVATILGHQNVNAVAADKAFGELGFDSITAIEFRNALKAVTGLQLPATLVFDYPTPQALAKYLADEFAGTSRDVEVTASRAVDTDPIAVVGMACRYPGGVTSPEELWELVRVGGDAVSTLPTDRGWDITGIYDPEPGRAGKSYTREGGFLHTAAEFDADFFGIGPNEATMMDPQQRQLLETTWEALERAGVDPAVLRGSSTGVFTGVMYHDYAQGSGNSATGSLVSGRIAYTLGLEGPAVSVDTACSSSLVAMHLAAQSLRSGECDLALAGGVAVMATPETFVEFSRQRGLAPDGRCKSFSDTADGVGWSEGAGMLVLERLSDAQRNGHQVLAVIAGSAVNQDGASNGLTAPNGPSQRRVIRQALANAGISPVEVDVVEAHGTGTTLGDPIEAQALLATYGQDRAADRPLWLGSLKSNIGHSQAAAGVGGVIKMVMAMRHGVLPKTLHVDAPSTKVDWSAGHIRLLTEAVAWPEVNRPRRAGVSSFGISGTNAHVIVEQAPAVDQAPVTTDRGDGLLPWVVSARSGEALRGQAARLASLVDDRDLNPADVGFSLASTRAVFEHRAVVVAESRDGLLAGVRSLAAGEQAAGVVTGRVTSGSTGLVFSGQGAQWAGMAVDLRAAYPVFAEAFDAIVGELDPLLGQQVSLNTALASADLVDQTVFAQAGLFAFEVALFRLLESWRVRADVVAGHSIGEVAAAHVAGVLSLTDACVLVAARGRLMQALPAGGAMVAVGASEADVLPLLAGEMSIAAVNGPASVVLSGVEDDVVAVAERCAQKGWRTHRLRVSHAFHSASMEPMLAEFATAIQGLAFARPRIPLVSTVTGARVTDEMSDPSYWVRQVREAVRFADAVATAAELGVSRFAEVGPDAVLTPMIAQTLDTATTIALTRRDNASPVTLLTGLARLHVTGATVDWTSYYAGVGGTKTDLPTYSFQHRRFWATGPLHTGEAHALGLRSTEHPMLGAMVAQPESGGVRFTGRLSTATHPWLADHDVLGTVLLPGTGFVELAVHAGDQVDCPELEELTLLAPLVLHGHGGVQIQVIVGDSDETGRRGLDIYSRKDEDDPSLSWTHHAHGTVSPGQEAGDDGWADFVQWPPAGATAVPLDGAYDELAENGYHYGPAFQGLSALWRRGADLFAEVALPEQTSAQGYGVHPALLDSAMHALSFGLPEGVDEQAERPTLVPFAWSSVRVHADGARRVRVRLTWLNQGEVTLTMADSVGAPLLSVRSLALRPLSVELLSGAARSSQDALYELTWRPGPELGSAAGVSWADWGAAEPASVLLFGPPVDGDHVPARLRTALHRTLGVIQQFLSEERYAATTLAVITDSEADPAAAAVWGLVRAAQAENPGRIVLIEARAETAADHLVAAAISGEPELAVDADGARVPRLARAASPEPEPQAPWDPERTVLITGGTGGIGRHIAEHLVTEHGVRHLLLAGRRGPDAVADLIDELGALGARVRVAACDVTDRNALRDLLASIPAEHPLGAVVHVAGVAHNGLIDALTPEQIDYCLGAKADAAWYLHELTRDAGLSAFVMISSVAGSILPAGQGGYAAANVFLDALATSRHAEGLPATSLAYGLWDIETGLSQWLSQADRLRMRRQGMPPLAAGKALELFDVAVSTTGPVHVPVEIDLAVLRARDAVPALLGDLAKRAGRRHSSGTQDAGALRRQLAQLSESEQEQWLRTHILENAARLLGHESADALDPERDFLEAGFDSLAAMELRTTLNASTGLTLPTAAIFDHKTPAALARYLRKELTTTTRTDSERVSEDDSLYGMFRGAVESGRVGTGFALLNLAAELREQFASASELDRLPAPARVAAGSALPRIICLTPPLATGGAHQYARIASHLRTAREVVALSPIGCRTGEPLPATPTAALEALARTVLEAAQGDPFVLLGYSSGGLLAYLLTEHLEAAGGPAPASVVMLDTYRVDDGGGEWLLRAMAEHMVSNEATFGRFDQARLSGMGWYVRLLQEMAPGPVVTPTLFVQCAQSFLGSSAERADWQAQPWDATHSVVPVQADHFTILEDGSADAADVIEGWLAG